MNTEIVLSAAFTCIVAIGAFAFKTHNRVLRMETILALLSQKAAEILHSPHTPGLDKHLDQIIEGKKLSKDNQREFMEILEQVEKNVENSKTERFLAAILSVITFFKK